MTTGYLWSGQFEELKKVINEGQPQSMELDEKTLDGHWATDNNLGVEFFIINDAVFSKLCILGDDIEPCFEGSAVTSPKVSENFTMNKEFSQTLFTMMNELKEALQSKGGSRMPEEFAQQAEIVDESAVEAATTEFATEEVVEEVVAEEAVDYTNADGVADDSSDEPEGETEFVKDDDKDDSEDNDDESDGEDDEDDDDKPTNHSLEEFEAMESELSSLRAEVEELREFKLGIENQQKDALINSYHMLSDEDKADVIEHKSEYSLDEIEAKLAVIYVKKNVDFNSLTGEADDDVNFDAAPAQEEELDPSLTFSLDDEVSGFVPSMVQALRQTVNR